MPGDYLDQLWGTATRRCRVRKHVGVRRDDQAVEPRCVRGELGLRRDVPGADNVFAPK